MCCGSRWLQLGNVGDENDRLEIHAVVLLLLAIMSGDRYHPLLASGKHDSCRLLHPHSLLLGWSEGNPCPGLYTAASLSEFVVLY